MVFSDLAAYVQTDLAPDGDKQFPTVVTAFSSSNFGKRLASFLKAFTVDTYLLYTSLEPITVVAGDREFDFLNPAKCAKAFHHVQRVWINNVELRREDSAADLIRSWGPLTNTGVPNRFAKLDRSRIIFDLALSANQVNCYAAGWYRHPDITSDNTVVQLPDEIVHLFSRYAQVLLREAVADDEVGLQRLQRFDKSAFDAIARLRSENMRWMHSGGQH
jgi:hypothetical protein